MTALRLMWLRWSGWERLLAASLALGVALLFLPYVLGYALPFAVVSISLGFFLLRRCYVSASKRNYARIAIYLPLTIAITVGGFALVAPKPELVDPAHEPFVLRVLREMRQGKKTKKALEEPPRAAEPEYFTYDPWGSRFNALYEGWYNRFPLISPVSPARFNFEHLRLVILAAVIFGASLVFWMLHSDDAESAWKELTRKRSEEYETFLREHREKMHAIERREKEFEIKREAIRQAIASRDQELERLRLREKYLTEGKPKTLAGTPAKPELDDFL